MAVTMQQALTKNMFHYGECKRTKGPRGAVHEHVEHWRRNGETKTWKTRPDEFRVPVKYGMRSYGTITPANAHEFHTEDQCPLLDQE